MGTERINPIKNSMKAKIELVSNRNNFSNKVNHILEKVKIKKLDEKEIKEIAIESYTCSY